MLAVGGKLTRNQKLPASCASMLISLPYPPPFFKSWLSPYVFVRGLIVLVRQKTAAYISVN